MMETDKNLELTSSWVIWQNNSDDTNVKSWGEDLQNVGTFKTIPEFMYLADKIKENTLQSLESIRIFKTGIRPMWEDIRNKHGGRIILDIHGIHRYDVNELWLKTMAFCVSNLVDGICGCVFMEKQMLSKLAIWVENDEMSGEIGKKWKEVTELPDEMFYYLSHKKSLDGSKHKRKWNKR